MVFSAAAVSHCAERLGLHCAVLTDLRHGHDDPWLRVFPKAIDFLVCLDDEGVSDPWCGREVWVRAGTGQAHVRVWGNSKHRTVVDTEEEVLAHISHLMALPKWHLCFAVRLHLPGGFL